MRWPWYRQPPVWQPPEDDAVTIHARELAQQWQAEPAEEYTRMLPIITAAQWWRGWGADRR